MIPDGVLDGRRLGRTIQPRAGLHIGRSLGCKSEPGIRLVELLDSGGGRDDGHLTFGRTSGFYVIEKRLFPGLNVN